MKTSNLLAALFSLFLFVSVVGQSPPEPIDFPDTTYIESCSGSICYDFSVNCEGDKDHRAIYVWESSSGSVLSTGTFEQVNCLSISDPTTFRLSIYRSDTLIRQSNWAFMEPLCLPLHLSEWNSTGVSPPFSFYNMHGEELSFNSYSEVPSGMYVLRWHDKAIKWAKQ